MELHKFHVHQLGACFVGQRHAVAGVFPRIGSDFPGFADATCSDDDGFCLEDDEAALFAPITESARDAVAIFQQARYRTLHVNVNSHADAAILERANHFQTGAIAYVAEALERMTTE